MKHVIGNLDTGKIHCVRYSVVPLLREKLDIISKVEADEKLHEVGRFYSINESTVRNMYRSPLWVTGVVICRLEMGKDDLCVGTYVSRLEEVSEKSCQIPPLAPGPIDIHEKIKDVSLKKFAADIVSVLAMTMSEERECLKYRLLGERGEVGNWGHEYVRHLAGEIAQEWETLGEDDDTRRAELIADAHVIVPYHMKHNAEAEACDLLMEMEQLDLLTSKDYVDKVGRILKLCAFQWYSLPKNFFIITRQ
ncbi:26S proteasome non-ATPase regulatory subunit 2 [Portunus trituberculatus]|uniref:26S proteasome non-ATPase regulatory subunit 2 n=1 Tax=Portunus trituberculatus TaxID=210409 RepID=A0A5B7F441_PORTR|nr:26S proteasome non-ATPase regulatory subunit 2 [Portunus trituberculatus]